MNSSGEKSTERGEAGKGGGLGNSVRNVLVGAEAIDDAERNEEEDEEMVKTVRFGTEKLKVE